MAFFLSGRLKRMLMIPSDLSTVRNSVMMFPENIRLMLIRAMIAAWVVRRRGAATACVQLGNQRFLGEYPHLVGICGACWHSTWKMVGVTLCQGELGRRCRHWKSVLYEAYLLGVACASQEGYHAVTYSAAAGSLIETYEEVFCGSRPYTTLYGTCGRSVSGASNAGGCI